MRPLEETLSRWQDTQAHAANLADLQRAVRYNGPTSPCISGCRSLCWKTFLLSTPSSSLSWAQILYDGRIFYADRRDHLLKFIKHPEALTELAVDPLADDPDLTLPESPWNTVRQDEIIRSEILQDVQRLPDEASYHEDDTQTMILDILFIYCKLNPDRGGYRQGMHELLAPIIYSIQQDAVDRTAATPDDSVDESMLQILDAGFIEHDAFILFSKLMEHAQAFYEVKDSVTSSANASPMRFQEQSSAIVERSKFIHEVCLRKVDPELAAHLTNIEILPQIFLIRWVRLLFSREFPFEQFLVLWDAIFAIDPTLELIDLICVAMLIRIRWDLLAADYSVCLQLLLRYPPPAQPHGPHTFVDDALYLRNHLTPSGGASLVMKYTGKMPTVSSLPDGFRVVTPNFRAFNSFRQKGFGARSPLPSPSRFIQQQGGIEGLFQGAAKGAKGVLERSERLGINQAVRDAMGEIKRNINEARYAGKSPQQVLNEEGPAKGLVALETRNRQLANMLDETVANLKALSASNLEDKSKSLELIEIAAAKVQFVKIYLEDTSMEVPVVDFTPSGEFSNEGVSTESAEANGADPKSQRDSRTSTAADFDVSTLKISDEDPTSSKQEVLPSPNPDAMDISSDKVVTSPVTVLNVRPSAPIPTRSTLAQSSFSWMLEPDETSPTKTPAATPKSPTSKHKKRVSNSVSRERNAFLFGEVTTHTEGQNPLSSEEIFGLEPIVNLKSKEPTLDIETPPSPS
ncbi:Fc.00g111620.m01.CDS01 [Cosmosporella sp. VM-42]